MALEESVQRTTVTVWLGCYGTEWDIAVLGTLLAEAGFNAELRSLTSPHQ